MSRKEFAVFIAMMIYFIGAFMLIVNLAASK